MDVSGSEELHGTEASGTMKSTAISGEKPDDDAFMQKALAEAAKAADEGEVPVGAVIVDDGRIVGRAHNQMETLHDATAHAEMIAITQAAEDRGDWRLDGMTLYTTVEPCTMCAGAVILARINRVVYGALDPRAGAAGSLFDIFEQTGHIHQLTVTGGILADECSMLMTEFFRKRRSEQQ